MDSSNNLMKNFAMQTENYFTQSLHLQIKNLINLRKAIYDRKELCVKSFQILFDAPKYWVHLFYIFISKRILKSYCFLNYLML